MNKVLIEKLGEEAFNKLDQQELKEQLFQYIKDNFILSIDDEKVQLMEGGIKLGSHQTDLKFIIPRLSEELKIMEISIPAFKQNRSHQTIFSYNINGSIDHLILNQDNNYQSTIHFSDANMNARLWITLIGLISLISLILVKKSSSRSRVLTDH